MAGGAAAGSEAAAAGGEAVVEGGTAGGAAEDGAEARTAVAGREAQEPSKPVATAATMAAATIVVRGTIFATKTR